MKRAGSIAAALIIAALIGCSAGAVTEGDPTPAAGFGRNVATPAHRPDPNSPIVYVLHIEGSASTTSRAPAELAPEVLGRLFELTVVLGESMAHGLAERGLTRARAELIWRLHERAPLTQRELAEALGVTPRNVTALLDALQAGGFVDRAPHPTDRRATFVTLSERGRTVAAGLHADQRAFAAVLFEGVAAPELARFDAALERIVARLHEIAPVPAEQPC